MNNLDQTTDPAAAFFEQSALDLVELLVLAHRSNPDNQPSSGIRRWLSTPDDMEPVELLESQGEHQLEANHLRQIYEMPERARAGVFATARHRARFI